MSNRCSQVHQKHPIGTLFCSSCCSETVHAYWLPCYTSSISHALSALTGSQQQHTAQATSSATFGAPSQHAPHLPVGTAVSSATSGVLEDLHTTSLGTAHCSAGLGTMGRRAVVVAAATLDDNDAVNPEVQRLTTLASILLAHHTRGRRSGTQSPSSAGRTGSAGLGTIEEEDPDLLDGIQPLNDDSLAAALGILRQQPDADDDSTLENQLLSKRLLDLLKLLERRPGGKSRGSRSGTATPGRRLSDEAMTGMEGFWSEPDEWADIRCALMNIGVDATLEDTDAEEDMTLFEGEARPQVLRRLPKFDSITAVQLAAFLSEMQQRRGVETDEPQQKQGVQMGGAEEQAAKLEQPGGRGRKKRAGKKAAVEARDADDKGGNASVVGAASDEDQLDEVAAEDDEWWDSIMHAYDLLWEQAQSQQKLVI